MHPIPEAFAVVPKSSESFLAGCSPIVNLWLLRAAISSNSVLRKRVATEGRSHFLSTRSSLNSIRLVML